MVSGIRRWIRTISDSGVIVCPPGHDATSIEWLEEVINVRSNVKMTLLLYSILVTILPGYDFTFGFVFNVGTPRGQMEFYGA